MKKVHTKIPLISFLGINSVRYGSQNIRAKGNSLFAVSCKGEVCTFNADFYSTTESPDRCMSTTIGDMQQNEFKQEIPVISSDCGRAKSTPFIHPLENSFGPGSALFVTAKIDENADGYVVLIKNFAHQTFVLSI